MMWSSKDMRTGAVLVVAGFILGAFCFSNTAQLESMRSSRETWKSKAETAQTELYTFRTNCATEKKTLGNANSAQLVKMEADLKMRQSQLDAAQKALDDMEKVRVEEIEKLDSQIGYLQERAEEMQRKNAELTVMQQTSISSIEMFTEKNGELLTSLLHILQSYGEPDAETPDLELGAIPTNEEKQELAENLPEAEIVEEFELEGEAQAELNDVQIGFEPPPRAVANAQIHEEEFHQQLNEELQMDHEDDYVGEDDNGKNGIEDKEEDVEVVEDDFNLDHEIAGVHPDHEDILDHIPEAQGHPIDLDDAEQGEAEFAPPMPKAGEAENVNRLLAAVEEEIVVAEEEEIMEKIKIETSKKSRKKKKKRKKRNVDS